MIYLKQLKTFTVLVMMMISNVNASENIPTLGDFPLKFPRDIIEVDTFLEHLLLGQVLEPLITADRLGNIQAGIARSWIFSPDGKSLTLEIDPNKFFSNGNQIKADDVVYSLKRHLDNPESQTHQFLNSVVSVEKKSEYSVRLNLNERRVAIVKVLSREQLGIVPNLWEFDPNSSEPIIGSGLYRLVKENSKWYLKINQKNSEFKEDMVPFWRIRIAGENGHPDYIPFATLEQIQSFKIPEGQGATSEQLSFVQSSFWRFPGSPNYKKDNYAKLYISLISELVEENLKNNHNPISTGVIPVGIAGHLKSRPQLNILDESTIKSLSKNIDEIKVSVPENILQEHFNQSSKQKIEKKYGVKIVAKAIPLIGRHKLIEEFNPDILLIRWAGGFNDPEGFLAILDKALGVPLIEYDADFGALYEKAKKEQDWSERNQMFEKMGHLLIARGKMVPAWKTKIYRYLDDKYRFENVSFRYSPRLADIRVKK